MEPFFLTDLPLPLSRKLNLPKIVPPAQVRDARQQIAAAFRSVTFRLTPAERDRIDAPVVDEWYRLCRGSKLRHYDFLFRDEALAGALSITKEQLDAVGDLASATHRLALANEYLEREAGDGRLVMDLLLTRGLRRIEEAVRAQLGQKRTRKADREALERRWEAVARPEVENEEEDPEDRPAGPVDEPAAPRDLLALVRSLSSAALDEVGMTVYRQVGELHVPEIAPRFLFGKDERRERLEREQAEIQRSTDPAAATRARACLRELYPAASWLPERSGVSPDALSHLLTWREAFVELGALSREQAGEIDDTERLGWMNARHTLRILHREIVDAVAALPEDKRFGPLFHLGIAIKQGRQSPPPKQVGQWIAERRRQIEQTWRARLGAAPLPEPAPEESESP